MKTLIICVSVHHGNTQKIAQAIAKILQAKIVKPAEVTDKLIGQYDLIGFGSGIYMWQHHQSLFQMLNRLESANGKPAFIFSTSGVGQKLMAVTHQKLKQKLENKGFTIKGEFTCRGYDTFGPLKYTGGISRGHPNDKDIAAALKFASSLNL